MGAGVVTRVLVLLISLVWAKEINSWESLTNGFLKEKYSSYHLVLITPKRQDFNKIGGRDVTTKLLEFTINETVRNAPVSSKFGLLQCEIAENTQGILDPATLHKPYYLTIGKVYLVMAGVRDNKCFLYHYSKVVDGQVQASFGSKTLTEVTDTVNRTFKQFSRAK
jgi:hypothetical protein